MRSREETTREEETKMAKATRESPLESSKTDLLRCSIIISAYRDVIFTE